MRDSFITELKKQAENTNWENYTEEDEKRMDIIGQNGNDGLHYDEVDGES